MDFEFSQILDERPKRRISRKLGKAPGSPQQISTLICPRIKLLANILTKEITAANRFSQRDPVNFSTKDLKQTQVTSACGDQRPSSLVEVGYFQKRKSDTSSSVLGSPKRRRNDISRLQFIAEDGQDISYYRPNVDPGFLCYQEKTYTWKVALQIKHRPTNFLTLQREVSLPNWTALVNWFRNSRRSLGQSQQTLEVAVLLMIRFLEQRPVPIRHMLLVALAALWVAAKIEEPFPPEAWTMLALCNNHFRSEHLQAMEQNFLEGLDFDLETATPLYFLEHRLSQEEIPIGIRQTAKELLEEALGTYDLMQQLPSVLGDAAFEAARSFRTKHFRKIVEEQVNKSDTFEGVDIDGVTFKHFQSGSTFSNYSTSSGSSSSSSDDGRDPHKQLMTNQGSNSDSNSMRSMSTNTSTKSFFQQGSSGTKNSSVGSTFSFKSALFNTYATPFPVLDRGNSPWNGNSKSLSLSLESKEMTSIEV